MDAVRRHLNIPKPIMHVRRIIVSNYRSFEAETQVLLQPGMNLLLGENNSGKSSVLQALSLDSIQYEPHLSLMTKPSARSIVSTKQRIGLEVEIGKSEIWKFFGSNALLPVPGSDYGVPDYEKYLSNVESLVFTIENESGGESASFNFYQKIESTICGGKVGGNEMMLGYRCPAGEDIMGGKISNYGGNSVATLFHQQLNTLQTFLYRFRAERLNIHQSPFGASTTLLPDARNLAECLNSMQSQQPHLFDEYVRYINHIFPSVHRVQAVAVAGQQSFEIRTWLVPTHARRPDLSISLSQAGTGVSQVLAILYVAMSSLEPTVIGIDEPNSFLHPKAVRSLLQILNSLPIKHQYIITTHSPEVIRSAEPEAVSIVVNDDGKSSIQVLDPQNIEHIKEGLASIGARLSDVYGADRILWVEGETEELTFPKIAQHIAKLDLIGVAILKVNATGDFEGSRNVRPRMVFETYRSLSNAGSLIPPAIGFVFDKEERTPREIADLTRDAGGAVAFLDRRCFENYLLNPNAIAEVLAKASGHPINASEIGEWLEVNGNARKYISPEARHEEGEALWHMSDWLVRVNAPKMLRDLFAEVPPHPEQYRKTSDSVALTDWLLQNSPEDLRPIAELLNGCFRAGEH